MELKNIDVPQKRVDSLVDKFEKINFTKDSAFTKDSLFTEKKKETSRKEISRKNTDDSQIKKEERKERNEERKERKERNEERKERNEKKDQEKKSVILKVETKEGYAFKILSDLFKNNIKFGNFIFDSKGIYLHAHDNKKNKLLKLKLYNDRFLIYKCPDKLCVGLNMMHFQKMLKSIRKKDNLSLSISPSEPGKIVINPIGGENGGNTNNFLRIIKTQKEDIMAPNDKDYSPDNEVSFQSKELQKSLKNLSSTSSKIVSICAKGPNIQFLSECEEMFSAECSHGEDPNIFKGLDPEELDYSQKFNFVDLFQLNKICGLSSSTVRISYDNNLPLRITLQVSNLGKLVVYIKSREIQDNEEGVENVE